MWALFSPSASCSLISLWQERQNALSLPTIASCMLLNSLSLMCTPQLCCRAFNLVVLFCPYSSSSLLLRCLSRLPLLSRQNQGNINTGNASGPLALSRQSLWSFARAPKGMNDSILQHCTENTHTCPASILHSVLLPPSALSLMEFKGCFNVTVPRLPSTRQKIFVVLFM